MWLSLPLAAFVLLALNAACVTHVFRHAAPACVARQGLDTVEDDLVLVNVVHGLFADDDQEFVISIPQGWHDAPVERRGDGCLVQTPPLALRLTPADSREVPDRQLRFAFRDTRSWSSETRARHLLVEPDEMEPAQRREYEIVNVRRSDGGVDIELRGHRADGQIRVLGTTGLPPEVTPRELSTAEIVLLTPPLAVIDAAWVPITVASFVLLIPFGILAHWGSDTDELPRAQVPRNRHPTITLRSFIDAW